MADREEQARGELGEMSSGGISPVIGDIDRRSVPSDERAGPDVGAGHEPGMQVLRELAYPLARDDMVREAAEHGGAVGLLDLLVRVPDRVYGSAEDVVSELIRPR